MRRFIRKSLFAVGLLAPTALCLPSCADNDTMLFVVGSVVPTEGTCTYKPDVNGTLYLSGQLDLAFRDTYTAVLLVGNQLVNRGAKSRLRTESSRVTLKGAEVTVMDDQEGVLTEFTVPGTGFVDIGSGEEPGYGLLATTLIPSGIAARDQLYIVDVRVFGETLGGSEVTSKALRYPIYACYGCLISYPQEAADPASPTYICSGGEKTTEPLPCTPGQDEFIDCRMCASTHDVCLKPGG